MLLSTGFERYVHAFGDSFLVCGASEVKHAFWRKHTNPKWQAESEGWIRTRENEVSASSQNTESQELARTNQDLTQKILWEHTRQNLSDGPPHTPAQYPEGHTRLQEKQGDRKYQNVLSPSYEVRDRFGGLTWSQRRCSGIVSWFRYWQALLDL